MKDEIVFFGASVVQQSPGYVDSFSALLDTKVRKFGFGGMHLYNAGICFVDKIVKTKARICFIDWFSTAYNNEDNLCFEYVKAIVNKLTDISCRCIFLILPHKYGSVKDVFLQSVVEFLDENELEYIDLRNKLKSESRENLLRDSIHTTLYGNKLYAEVIYDYFINYKKEVRQISFPKTMYENIKSIGVKNTFYNEMLLSGKCYVLGMTQYVGPFSGIITLHTGKSSSDIQLWDKWCFYIRKHFSISLEIDGIVRFEVSNKKVDTSSCKKSIDFERWKRKLVIDRIYYIGDSINIVRGERKKFLFQLVAIKAFVKNLKHRIVKVICLRNKVEG